MDAIYTHAGWCLNSNRSDPIRYGCEHAYAVTAEGAERLVESTSSCPHGESDGDFSLSTQIHDLILKQKLRFDVYHDESGCRVLREGGRMIAIEDHSRHFQSLRDKNYVVINTDISDEEKKRLKTLRRDSCGFFRQYKYQFGAAHQN